MKAFHVEQSLPICCSLAALGGILEVAATAVTAVPAVREKEGITLRWWVQWLAIAGNVGLQAVGSLLSHLIATWFGPVSLVVPFFYSATLLSNVLIFGLLGERFTKNMRVGTHVIVVAVILLPVVGPDIQEGQDIAALFRHWYSIVWFTLLLVACAITGVLLVLDVTKYNMQVRTVILLVARAASISVNLSVSRAFIMGLNDTVLTTFIVIKLVSGAIYTYAIVVQSFAVEQARFVPLNATTIIIVNALTGIILWEDWRVVSSWYGYVCIFVLLGLGCDLLLSVPLLHAENPEFGAGKRASMMIQQHQQHQQWRRSPSSTNHYDNLQSASLLLPLDASSTDYDSTSSHQNDNPQNNNPPADYYGYNTPSSHRGTTGRASRIDAWKELLSPIQSRYEDEGDEDEDYYDDGVETEQDQKEEAQWQQQQQQQQSQGFFQTTTPQKVGNAVKDATIHIIQQPFQLGGRLLATAASAITPRRPGGGRGEEEDSSPQQRHQGEEAESRKVSPQQQQHQPQHQPHTAQDNEEQAQEEESSPQQNSAQDRAVAAEEEAEVPHRRRMSRIAAWRETVSPIRSRKSSSAATAAQRGGGGGYQYTMFDAAAAAAAAGDDDDDNDDPPQYTTKTATTTSGTDHHEA